MSRADRRARRRFIIRRTLPRPLLFRSRCFRSPAVPGRALRILVFLSLGAGLCLSPSFLHAQAVASASVALPDAPAPQSTASLFGTVFTATGTPVRDATITLSSEANTPPRSARTGRRGTFSFLALPPGTYTVKVTADRMEPIRPLEITLAAGQSRQLPITAVRVPRFTSTVHVNADIDEIAKAQVKEAEKQRVLAIIPNFYTSYEWNAVPITPKLKFQLAYRSMIDPFTFITTAGLAGFEQWHHTFPGYGTGIEGYAKRYGAAYADTLDSRFIGTAILPSIFHQDPRYFYRGSGTTSTRLLYALRESVMCRGDNGRQEVNYSHIFGSFAAAGVGNVYRTPQDRSVSLTIRDGFIIMSSEALDNVLREFFTRTITSHIPPNANGKH